MRIIQGDDEIAGILSTAMHACAKSLVEDGLLTVDQGNEWLDTHICVVVDRTRFRRLWDKWFTTRTEENAVELIVVQAAGKRGVEGREK